MVDGEPLQKNKEVAVAVGAKLTFANSETVYQVHSYVPGLLFGAGSRSSKSWLLWVAAEATLCMRRSSGTWRRTLDLACTVGHCVGTTIDAKIAFFRGCFWER